MAANDAREFRGGRLVIASHNPGKVREIGDLILPYCAAVVSASKLGLEEPEECGATFVENAELKALVTAENTGLPALADDSGLVVAALGGDPGIYSARWAGPENDFYSAMKMIEDRLKEANNRDASFVCALSLAWPDGHLETVEGRVDGRLVWPPRGAKGFGYDPIFVAKGYNLTFGEMRPEDKYKISHRNDAFKKLVAVCFSHCY